MGSKSIRSLHNYIDGVVFAGYLYDVKNKMDDFNWEEFEQWVQKETATLGRSFLAAEMKTSDELAFDLWFDWYDQYNKSKGKEDYDNWLKNNKEKEIYMTEDEGDSYLY